eukprot:scaffold4925_cov125-Isochrysis_galbana.AAC.4
MSIYGAVHPTFECLNAKKEQVATWPWRASCLTNRASSRKGDAHHLNSGVLYPGIPCSRWCGRPCVCSTLGRESLQDEYGGASRLPPALPGHGCVGVGVE